jgi:AGZA family xanthine/uracil permease-like MFS transporter
VAPLVGAIPVAATAPALILVGSMMMTHIAEIDWKDMVVAIPAFLTIIAIPLTFSIANGIAFGFTMFTLMCVLRGEFRRVNWLMYILTLLFMLRFFYLGAG